MKDVREGSGDRLSVSPRVACVGAGHWGKNIIRNMDALGALGWICETDPTRRAEMAEDYPHVRTVASFEELLELDDVSAYAIATPAASHGQLTKMALERDKDVFVEKPLCLSVKEGEALVAMAECRGRVLMVGHLLWYHPAIRKLKELVDSGALGRIQYIYSNRLNFGQVRRAENILWSFAPHDISVILGLLNEAPDRVTSTGGNFLHEGIADVTVTHLHFPSGVKAHVFVSWLHPFKEQKLVVVGDAKMAVFDDAIASDKLTLYAHSIRWQQNVPVLNKASSDVVPVGGDEPLLEECREFLNSLVSRVPPLTDGREALRVLAVLEQSQRCLDGPGEQNDAGGRHTSTPQSQTSYFAHASSYVDDSVSIGEGTKIWHFCHVLRNSTVGKNCRLGQNVVLGPDVNIGNNVKIQNNVSVYEGVTLEDDVFCGPSMVFTNVHNPRSEIPRMHDLRMTHVGRGATLGANCTIICGVTIGEYAFVGAGAVVTRDVPPHALVLGNPARTAGWVCRCGHRLKLTDAERATCTECGSQLERDPSGLLVVATGGG